MIGSGRPTFPPSTFSKVFITSITRELISSLLNPDEAAYPLHFIEAGVRERSWAWGRRSKGVMVVERDGRARRAGRAARYIVTGGLVRSFCLGGCCGCSGIEVDQGNLADHIYRGGRRVIPKTPHGGIDSRLWSELFRSPGSSQPAISADHPPSPCITARSYESYGESRLIACRPYGRSSAASGGLRLTSFKQLGFSLATP